MIHIKCVNIYLDDGTVVHFYAPNVTHIGLITRPTGYELQLTLTNTFNDQQSGTEDVGPNALPQPSN